MDALALAFAACFYMPDNPSLDLFHLILQEAIARNASDVHLRTHSKVFFRIHGELVAVPEWVTTRVQLEEMVAATLPQAFQKIWYETLQVNYAYRPAQVGQFRVNAFYQRGTPSLVLRHVTEQPPKLVDLSLPLDLIQRLCGWEYGLVLVSGSVGSGKSSTLAGMLQYINESAQRHIVTLEDPIEFIYQDQQSIFNQREVGLDVPSFLEGLKAALRQDPDVILVGEIRDRSTAEMVLSAAETGHLVLASLHATDAQQTLQRFGDFFPPDQQGHICRMLSAVLRATLTQKLALRAQAKGRLPVVECFHVDGLAREIIGQREFYKIPQLIEAGYPHTCQAFNDDLQRLIEEGAITEAEGLRLSPNPEELKMRLKGILISRGGLVN